MAMMEENAVASMDIISGDVITITCSTGEVFVGGNPRKTCGNDGNLHPPGGQCVAGRSVAPSVPELQRINALKSLKSTRSYSRYGRLLSEILQIKKLRIFGRQFC